MTRRSSKVGGATSTVEYSPERPSARAPERIKRMELAARRPEQRWAAMVGPVIVRHAS